MPKRRTGSGSRPQSRTSFNSRRRDMRWFYTLPLRLKSIFRSAQVEREMDDELRFHFEHKIEEGIADGLSPQDARIVALRAMDGLEQRKEEIRDARRIHWPTGLLVGTPFATPRPPPTPPPP